MSDNSLKKGRYTRHSNKIGLYSTSHDRIGFLNNNNDVVLSFPFKDTVLEAGMNKEDTGREERFLHHEIDGADIDTLFEPKVFTNFKLLGSDKNIQDTTFFNENGNLQQNLLIKGNNLLALHSLSERLAGKVKLIYIDPPYNTGSDSFKYNDSFNHSSWLTFMKNRLEVAKNLLSDDGLIFIQCDDNEQAYLKVLMDEILDRANFAFTVCVKMSHLSGMKMNHRDKKLPKIKEFIHVYSRNPDKIALNEVFVAGDWDTVCDRYDSYLFKNDSDDPKDWTRSSLRSAAISFGVDVTNKKQFHDFCIKNADVIYQRAKNDSLSHLPKDDVFKKVKTSTGLDKIVLNSKEVLFASSKIKQIGDKLVPAELIGDIWTDIGINNSHNEGGVALENGKKPEKLIQRIIELATNENDIVLDYHLGSGTTCAVAHKMGRRWVGIEQMDYIEDLAKVRLKKVIEGEQGGISKSVDWKGGGSFIYFELKKYNQDFLDKIMIANSKGELDEVYNEMAKNAFLKFWFDKNEFEKDENFRSLDLDRRKELLIGILDDNQLYLNHADMRDSRYHVTDEEMALTDLFYGVNND